VGGRLREGTVAVVLGPAYETPAEIRMLRRLGVEAVTMSGASELQEARRRGIAMAFLAVATNWAAGMGPGTLHHEEVLRTVALATGHLAGLVARAVEGLPEEPGQGNSGCGEAGSGL
jgi:purine-nucleoside phosphorylase